MKVDIIEINGYIEKYNKYIMIRFYKNDKRIVEFNKKVGIIS